MVLDHSAGYNKATSGNDHPLHHNSCGGFVMYDFFTGLHNCQGCKQQWSAKRMYAFTPFQIGERFHVRPYRPEGDPEVLVEKVDGKNRYISSVPATEAHLYKKAKL